MKMKLDEVVAKAKELGSYYVTVTTRNKDVTENDLNHYYFQEDFPRDDIIPSLDNCVQLLGVKPSPAVDVIKPPMVNLEHKKPLKIAILTHFNQAPEYYSPARAVRNQVEMLKRFGHTVVFFTQEGSNADFGCEMRHVVPKFKRQKNVVNEEAKGKFIDVLREELTADFDIAITHDFYIDDCVTYREAIKESGVPIQWLHWARSGVGRGLDFHMENARYVYMNYADVGQFAQAIGVGTDKIRVVFNDKDPGIIFDWHPTTKMIVDKARLWERDIIQVYPICTTRMDAKGINSVIRTFGELKKLGNNVALIICNANGRKRLDEINNKVEFAAQHGLTEEDVIFTSKLSTDECVTLNETPHKVVMDLMRIANLFVFATIAEVCPNILLEAAMCRNLIVINQDLPLLRDLTNGAHVLAAPFTSGRSMHYGKREDKDYRRLGRKINGQLKSNKADMQFRETWRNHRLEAIYEDMLAPILYEDV